MLLILNKVDLLHKQEQLLPIIDECSKRGKFSEIIPFSARSGHNLDRLLGCLRELTPNGSHELVSASKSSQKANFMVAEFVREQVFRLVGAEVPYRTAVKVERYARGGHEVAEFHAEIWVETAGQKAILLGRGGERLRNIGARARTEAMKSLGVAMVLKTRVKVHRGWSSNPKLLQKLGYLE